MAELLGDAGVGVGDVIALLGSCGGIPQGSHGLVFCVDESGTPFAKFAAAVLQIEVPAGLFCIVRRKDAGS